MSTATDILTDSCFIMRMLIMDTKICTRCKNIFPETLDFFHKKNLKLTEKCKKCISEYRKENSKKWNLNEYNKKYLQRNPDKAKKYLENSKDKKRKSFKIWYEKNKEKQSIKHKKWRLENLERHRKNYRSWKEKNDRTKYHNNRRKNILKVKLMDNVRRRINSSIKSKKNHSIAYLGIDILGYIKYLETLFKENMSWDNYGEWHIDHIIPLSSAKNEEELTRLFHYTNTQPLWAKDNLKKGNKI